MLVEDTHGQLRFLVVRECGKSSEHNANRGELSTIDKLTEGLVVCDQHSFAKVASWSTTSSSLDLAISMMKLTSCPSARAY